MFAERLPSVDEVASSLEGVSHRFTDSDLAGASRSALTSARHAIPDGWPGHRNPRRWPWVAAIILGTTLLGVIVVAPAFRRYMTVARSRGGPIGVPEDGSDEFMPAAEATNLAGGTPPHPSLPIDPDDE